jgi:4-oxalocrotonate tautomerase
MFIIEITITEGRSPEQKERLHAALTLNAGDALGWDRDDVRTVIREVPLAHWGAGGQSFAARAAAEAPR